MKKILTILTAVALLAPAALAQTGAVRGGDRDRLPVLDAKDFNLKRLAGRVALVAFWKTPDEASDLMLPWLSGLQEEYGQAGLTVVAVNENEKTAGAADAAAVLHPRIQLVIDAQGRLPTRYGLSQVPGLVLFDRAGERRGLYQGFAADEADSLAAAVAAVVGEGADSPGPGK